MQERTFVVPMKLGLHARPAALLVQTTTRFRSKVAVVKGAMEVDGKSIMGLLMLAAEFGSQLTIRTHGEDEGELMRKVEKLFQSRFDED